MAESGKRKASPDFARAGQLSRQQLPEGRDGPVARGSGVIGGEATQQLLAAFKHGMVTAAQSRIDALARLRAFQPVVEDSANGNARSEEHTSELQSQR